MGPVGSAGRVDLPKIPQRLSYLDACLLLTCDQRCRGGDCPRGVVDKRKADGDGGKDGQGSFKKKLL